MPTDNEILKQIADASGDNFDPPTTTEPEVTTPEPQPQPTPTPTATPVTDEQPVVDGDPWAALKPDPKTPATESVRRDDKGNIVDKDGNIIAARGAERRIYQQNERLRASLADRDAELNRLRADNQRLAQVAETPKRLGLTNEDLVDGYAIMAMFKTNPVQAVHEVIARALKLGYDMTDFLGPEAQGAVQTSAIRGLLDERLAPLQQQQTAQINQQEIDERARREFNDFLTKYPDADLHPEAINAFVKQDQSKDPAAVVFERAYLQLETWCARNNYDISLPLKPQIEARQAAQTQPALQPQPSPQQRVTVPHQQPSFPNGRAGQAPMMEPDMMVAPTDSWDAIISKVRQSMANGGMGQ